MSLKNQMLIVGKIKSIDPNFVPSIEVDSRAAPDERELEFMANLVIAVNNLKNFRNVNKIFFNRQVKSYNHYGPRQQTVRSYRDGSIELYVNLHHHDLNVERTLTCITSERNQEFIRTRQSYENVNFVKAEVTVKEEVKEVVKAEVKEVAMKTEVKEVAMKTEVKEVKMNDEKTTIQKSVFGYDDVCGDDGESWVVFSPKTEVEEEEVSMNVAVKDEVKENEMNNEFEYDLVFDENGAHVEIVGEPDSFGEDGDFNGDGKTKSIVSTVPSEKNHIVKMKVSLNNEFFGEYAIKVCVNSFIDAVVDSKFGVENIDRFYSAEAINDVISDVAWKIAGSNNWDAYDRIIASVRNAGEVIDFLPNEVMDRDEVFAKTDRMVAEMKHMGAEFDFVKETSKAVIEKFLAGNKFVNMDLEASATEVYNAYVAHFSKNGHGMTFDFPEVGLIFASTARNEYL